MPLACASAGSSEAKAGEPRFQLGLCVLGVVLPYWQIAPWPAAHGPDVPLLFRQLFESRVGAFFGLDVFVSAAAPAVFVFAEGARLCVRALRQPVLALLGRAFLWRCRSSFTCASADLKRGARRRIRRTLGGLWLRRAPF